MGAFTGKTVLILGGSRGIGAAIVRRFVTDGANVRFTYAGSKDAAKRLAQETGATAVFTDSADRDAVIDVVRKSGALDILVVNAGIGVFGECGEVIVSACVDHCREKHAKPYGTRLWAGQAVSARLVGK